MKATKTLLSIAVIAALPFAAHATDPVVAVGPAHASSNPVVATANAPYVTVTPTQADESHIATTAYVKGAYNDAIAAVNNVANDVSGKQGKLMNTESTPQPISNNVLSSNAFGGMEYIGVLLGSHGVAGLQVTQDEFDAMVYDMGNEIGADLDNTLPTTETVYKLIRGASDTVYTGAQSVISDLQSDLADKQDKLVAVSGSGTTPIDAELMDTGVLPSIMRNHQTNAALPDVAASGDFANKLILADDVMSAIGILRVPLYTAWDTNTTTKVSLAVATNAQE